MKNEFQQSGGETPRWDVLKIDRVGTKTGKSK